MSKVGVKGKAGAHKVMLMVAIAYNLRKYMNFEPVKVKAMALVRERKQVQPFLPLYLPLLAFFYLKILKIRPDLHLFWNKDHEK